MRREDSACTRFMKASRLGPTQNRKKRTTSASRLPAITVMMLNSLPNTERRWRTGQRESGIVAADEAVAHPAHGADEARLPGVVAQLLAHAADQHVDRAVVRLPVDA